MTRYLQAGWAAFASLVVEIVLGTMGVPVPATVLGLTAAAVVHGFHYVRIPLVVSGLVLDAVLGRPAPASVVVFALLCPAASAWLRRTDRRNPFPSAVTGAVIGFVYAVTISWAARRAWNLPPGVPWFPSPGTTLAAGILGAVLLPGILKACSWLHVALTGDRRHPGPAGPGG